MGRRGAAPISSTGDRLASFQPLIQTVRWGTALIGVTLALSGARHRIDYLGATTVVVWAALRTWRPIRLKQRFPFVLNIVAEIVLVVALVLSSGYWDSPFVFCLVVPGVVAGFTPDLAFTLAVALTCVISVAAGAVVSGEGDAARLTAAGGGEVLVLAIVASYALRVFGEAERRTSQALTSVSRLTEVNDLLLQLNRAAQTLPASLVLEDTLASTVDQVRQLLRPTVVVVLLWDDVLAQWSVGVADGVRLPLPLVAARLPEPIRNIGEMAKEGRGSVVYGRTARLVDLEVEGPGLGPSSRTAIYVPLVARLTLVGMLAVEAAEPDALADRDRALVTGLAEQAALAIDNARWFGRLRTIGAEEERNRIARELHDRVAQSLAYLAFELDRITQVAKKSGVSTELQALRNDVRQVVTEVRDTLYDLRTNVTEVEDLVHTLEGFLERVRSRSGVEVLFDHDVRARLPLPVEREFWRIAQEAITNVERHARATKIEVSWQTSTDVAHLRVSDNGRGFPVGAAGRMDSYGIMGMKERADAIGAVLEIHSIPFGGTIIDCRLEMT